MVYDPPNTHSVETLSVNGRRVIPAREAVRRTGWSQNYIGLICRAGELLGVRLSAGWLVDEQALAELRTSREHYKTELQEKHRDERRREYARNQDLSNLFS